MRLFNLFLCLVTSLMGKTIYVDDNASAGGDGSSWSNPYQDLQDAFDVALSGDEIWIAEGVYYKEGGFVLSDIADSQRFHVFGSFRNGETSKVNRDFSAVRTVISGDLLQNDSEEWSSTEREENDKLLTVENSYTIHFDGIDFENGIGEYQGFAGERKAAITLKDTSIVFNKCLFLRNGYSTGDPMGVASAENCSVNFINCIFVENTGGIFHGRSVTTPSGNGSLSVNFTNNVFYGNYRSRLGSLVWITSVSSTSSATSLLQYSTIVGDHKFYSSPYASTTGAGNIFYSTGTLYNSDPTDQGIDSETLPSIYSDYEFFNISSPNGSDGKWGTEDDGLRLEYSDSLRISGEKFYDNHDIDQDGIFNESAPFNLYGASASLTPILMYGAYDLASVPVNFTISWDAHPHGSVSGTGTFTEGKEIEIQAIPEEGYAFWKWDIIDFSDAEPSFNENFEVTLRITVSGHLLLYPKFVKTDLLNLADHDLSSGWFKSDWFGIFWGFSDEWIYHSALGWLYVHPKDSSSYWMWSSEYGWLWISSDHFPYIYQNSSSNQKYANGSWLYLNESNGKLLRYDNQNSKWLDANPLVRMNILFDDQYYFEDFQQIGSEGNAVLSQDLNSFGYDFAGWYVGDQIVSEDINATIYLEQDSDVIGKWQMKDLVQVTINVPNADKQGYMPKMQIINEDGNSSWVEFEVRHVVDCIDFKNSSYHSIWVEDFNSSSNHSNLKTEFSFRYPKNENLKISFLNEIKHLVELDEWKIFYNSSATGEPSVITSLFGTHRDLDILVESDLYLIAETRSVLYELNNADNNETGSQLDGEVVPVVLEDILNGSGGHSDPSDPCYCPDPLLDCLCAKDDGPNIDP